MDKKESGLPKKETMSHGRYIVSSLTQLICLLHFYRRKGASILTRLRLLFVHTLVISQVFSEH